MTTPQDHCPLASRLLPSGTALQMLGLALMAGGMLALGAFTAPVVFGQLGREAGAPIMAIIFRRYDILLLVCLGLALLGEALRTLSRQLAATKLQLTRYILLGLLTVGVLFSTLKVNADIARLNKMGVHRDTSAQGQAFEREHKLSENLYKLELLCVIGLILLTPFATAGSISKTAGDHA